jgi:hypothetical protein
VTQRGLETASGQSTYLINALIGQVTPRVQTVRFDGIARTLYRFGFLACASYSSPGLDTANFPLEHNQRRNAHETKHRPYRGVQPAGGWPTFSDGFDFPGGRSFAVFEGAEGFTFLLRVGNSADGVYSDQAVVRIRIERKTAPGPALIQGIVIAIALEVRVSVGDIA